MVDQSMIGPLGIIKIWRFTYMAYHM
jgi:hypothetical protein